MALTRMVLEMGMGTDLQGSDYTKAAVRAVKDALWHNSLTVAPAFGIDKELMKIELAIGVAKPDEVDIEQVKAVCAPLDIRCQHYLSIRARCEAMAKSF